jgi:hypothetical protein
MAAPMTRAALIAQKVADAQARGVTDPLALQSIRAEAADTWDSYLNTFSGRPLGFWDPVTGKTDGGH